MNRTTFSLSAVAFALALSLSACGGGGGGSDSAASPSGSAQPQPTMSTSMAVITLEPVMPGVSVALLEGRDAAGTHANLIQLDYAAFDGSKTELFADTASAFELESYEIHSNELVEFDRDSNQLTITNWVPRDLDNVLVAARYNGVDYRVLKINHLPGLQKITLSLPWSFGSAQFQSLAGDIVNFAGIDSKDVSFKLLPQDAVQQSIVDIRASWELTFPDRVMLGSADFCRDANVVWRPTRPQDGRYLLAFMIKAAQTVSDGKFYEFWMKTAFINWNAAISDEDVLTLQEYETYGAEEKAQYEMAGVNSRKYYNKAHRQKVFDKYLAKHFALGMTGGGGLGGGATLGLNHTSIFQEAWGWSEAGALAAARNEWYLTDQSQIDGTPWNIMGHEGGHTLGFGHDSSYTVRAPNSHVTVGTIVYSALLANGKAIVTPETMSGRDESWEQPYDKNAPAAERSRPTCGNAFEWGGPYGRHDIQLPTKGSTEWFNYLEAHRNGTGLDYLRSLNGG